MSANVGKLCCGKTMYKHQLRRHIIGLMRITSYVTSWPECVVLLWNLDRYEESIFCAKSCAFYFKKINK